MCDKLGAILMLGLGIGSAVVMHMRLIKGRASRNTLTRMITARVKTTNVTNATVAPTLMPSTSRPVRRDAR